MHTQNDRLNCFSIWHLWYLLIGTLLAIIIFFIDEMLPLGVAGGIAYIALALIGLLMRDNRVIVFGGVIGVVLTIIGFFLKPPGAMLWMAVTNRSLTVFMIALTTFLFLRQNQYGEKLLEAHNELEDRVKERTAQLKEAYDLARKESSYIQLHKDIIVSTNENNPVEDTFRYALERICKVTGWSVGHIYFTESVLPKLMPTDIWYLSDSQQFQQLKKVTDGKVFVLGEGLPGRVLAGGKPVWIKDVYEDDNFPRAKMEADLGIRSGFAFPLLIGKEVAGVMEFFSTELVEEDRQTMEVMGNIGTQLGRTIERRRAHEERESSQEQMRRLCRRLELVREEERTRIAREVHDELGQVLTTLKLELSLLDKKLIASGNKSRTRVMLDLVDNTIQTIKRISLELRPPILDVLGLAEAIQWQGKEFQDRTGIQFDFRSSPSEISMEPERSTTIFRIFQETLTNVARHAEASKLNVNLMDSDGILTLVVKDDGKGITPTQISDHRSLGILGMRERALVWGGEVDICGAQSRGTTVTIKIKH